MTREISASTRWWCAGFGVFAAAFGVVIGSLVAAMDSAYAPLNVVASAAIDIPGAAVKSWATETFGTNAKTVTVLGVAIALLILAVIAGLLARKRLWVGVGMFLAIGVIGALAGVQRPGDDIFAVVPSLVAGTTAAATLWFFDWLASARARKEGAGAAIDRRNVLLGGAAIMGAGVAGVFVTRSISAGEEVQAARVATGLPTAASTLPPLPPSVQAPVPGLSPFITPNDEFYKIDTTLVSPQVDAATWSLSIGGMARRPFTITYAELLAMPMEERDITIMCVSNPIGGGYIGNARWLGARLMPLLEQAGIEPGADQLFSTSVDGWTCSTPLNGLAERDPILAIGMNGVPLPIEHGYPVRMVIPGLYGFISATKWVSKIEAATYADMPAYWTTHGWATDAPVLTGSRIDLPRQSTRAGTQPIAGVAWAMNGKGISKVEVSVDDGEWLSANLADVPNTTTWRQWWLPFEFTPGTHEIAVRATNGEGELQTSEVRDVVPAGATGFDSRIVQVEATA